MQITLPINDWGHTYRHYRLLAKTVISYSTEATNIAGIVVKIRTASSLRYGLVAAPMEAAIGCILEGCILEQRPATRGHASLMAFPFLGTQTG